MLLFALGPKNSTLTKRFWVYLMQNERGWASALPEARGPSYTSRIGKALGVAAVPSNQIGKGKGLILKSVEIKIAILFCLCLPFHFKQLWSGECGIHINLANELSFLYKYNIKLNKYLTKYYYLSIIVIE